MVKKTKHYSHKTGKLAKGCQLCVKGKKSVLFATGVCPRDCFFCPISDYKKNKDVVFINELEIKELELDKLVKEIQISSSKGVGITGGDPLSKLNRTAGFIKLLKEKFGKKFHIHLYTSFIYGTDANLKKLVNAGLDEIRFHADLDYENLWKNIDNVKKFNVVAGIEVPVIPDKEKELLKLIDFFKDKVTFFNFNELEMSDNKNVEKFKKNYSLDTTNSYAVKGSHELGLKLLEYCKQHKLNAHFCSVKLKDRVQLAKRIKLRAKKAKLKTDKITKEGLIKRGVIYSAIVPGMSYDSVLFNLNKSDRKKELIELGQLKKKINKVFDIQESKLFIDTKKLRILTSERIARKLSKLIPEQCAVVLEYPTADSLEVEIDLIKP